ncbi:Bug family tripartite tricarboxylate transporter substrate binding protein [Ramlibacter sp.]|uniref:Bug family tripartite tricarboxylate transporter substrate binding protein n=1 Tax=Ramlibacter sp. TaxID=1917967 RepID=UPI003D14FD8C
MSFTPTRRVFASSLIALAASGALAQSGYPNKPIRIVVPFGPGSGTDVVARIIAEELQGELGQTVIVENKPGANGTIAADLVAKAPADGYTLVMGGSSTHSSAPSLFKNLPYDPVTDFTMVGNTVETQFALVVRAESPAQSLKELTALLQAKAGKGTFGFGSATTQIAGAALMKRLNLNVTPVPYKSNPLAITDLIGGQFDFMFLDLTTAMPQIRGGRVRALAVAAPARVSELPQVPVFAEIGVPNFTLYSWLGIMGPKGLPEPVADRLANAMTKIMNKQTVKDRLAPTGKPIPPVARSTYPAYLREQRDGWAGKIKDAGIQPE